MGYCFFVCLFEQGGGRLQPTKGLEERGDLTPCCLTSQGRGEENPADTNRFFVMNKLCLFYITGNKWSYLIKSTAGVQLKFLKHN